jgi:hypothetical protein
MVLDEAVIGVCKTTTTMEQMHLHFVLKGWCILRLLSVMFFVYVMLLMCALLATTTVHRLVHLQMTVSFVSCFVAYRRLISL